MAVINTNQYSALGVQYAFWAALNGYYPYGTTGTIANGAGAGMGRMLGVQDANVTPPQAGNAYVPGDNGVVTVFKTQPTELPTGTLTVGVEDQVFNAKANGSKVYFEGDWDISYDLPLCYSFADLMFIFNSPGSSQETSSKDEASWVVTIWVKVQVQAAIMAQMQNATPWTFAHNITMKRASNAPWGQAMSVANHGSTAYGVIRFNSDYPVTMHTFIGGDSTTTVTLNETPAAASSAAVQLWQTNVKKVYTTDYTLVTSTKVVTFAAAPGTGVVNQFLYKFVPSC